MPDFLMPKLGADMTEGTLIAWRKQPGDAVRRGDIVAEVETEKGVIDVEIFDSGVIDKLLTQPGEKVPVGAVLAIIKEDGAAPVAPMETPPVVAPAAVNSAQVSAVGGAATRLPISPSARRLARERGVDPATVRGTGPRGAVTREDIERAAATQAGPLPAPLPPAADRQSPMRQAIAAAMSRSKREIPHYYLSTDIDMFRAMTWLAAENEKRPVADRLLYGALLLKAVALALHEAPELNALWQGDCAVPSEAIHVGVATALRQGGLIAPALHHTDRHSLTDLMRKLRDLVNRARTGRLRSSELSDPTITVTSLGEQGVEAVFPIIYPPQVAIVGFGKVTDRPWVADGQVVVRPVITATLAADHRVSDGHRSGRFLAALDRLLQEPDKL
jgi:pyruvate dehydrogenase E2 component (dihydrolipoamide acetyltransferase)